MRARRRWQGPGEQIKEGGDGGVRQCVGRETREESRDELLLWEEKRMMGGLCQQAWAGEEDGDEGEVCLEHRRFWDEQNSWLCNCSVWVFNEPCSACSLATELLLLAGAAQHKHTHIQTSFLKVSCIKRHTQHIHFRNENPVSVRDLSKLSEAEFLLWTLVLICVKVCMCVSCHFAQFQLSSHSHVRELACVTEEGFM